MKKPVLLCLSILFLLPAFLSAQKDIVRIDFYDAEFFLSEEAYRDALIAYLKVYDAGNENNANVNYRIGICYMNIPGEKEKAIPYFQKAVKDITPKYKEGNYNEFRAPLDAWLYLGNAYRVNNLLDSAINTYQIYIDLLADKNNPESRYTEQQIIACNRAKESMKDPVYLKKTNLGRLYNTGLNNYNAVVSGNGEVMAYMSEQKFYNAVYVARKTKSGWSNPVNVTPQIQSDGDQIVTSLSYDGDQMFLAKVSNFDSDILTSNYSARIWSKSENIGKPINTKFFESHASLSPDGKTLYFTSNRNESLGQMDIFKSTLNDKGKWSEPVNLGPEINTPMNEESPFIMNDGKTLYFSSQGHSTIGGFDVFYSKLQDDGTWSKPSPLPYPLNTTDDDAFYFPLETGEAGYMTRYERDSYGGGDIYMVELRPVEETPAEELAEAKTDEPVEKQEAVNDKTSVADTENIGAISETKDTEHTPIPDPVKTEPLVRYLVKPLFFGFDSYSLTEISISKLQTLIKALEEHPEIKLEVRGHTDALGSVEYNQRLSERRAKAALKYLTDHGIDSSRLTFAGFSKNNPAALNTNPDGTDSQEGRQLNRRVEFKIVPGKVEEVIIEKVEVPETLKIK